jgi:5-methylcytosine-specific restriction endonuclease McrA
VPWDGVTDAEILDRDDWVCWLCELAIDPELHWPDGASRSVDHVVPLSRGGDDTAANKRAAHLRCNIARGNRMPSDQDLRRAGLRAAFQRAAPDGEVLLGSVQEARPAASR